jgi:putative glutamine amidotransferase
MIRIGITDCGKFENYRRWIAEGGAEVIRLSANSQNASEAESCDGILFSGGEDLHPGLYGKPEYQEQYGLKDILPDRDEFEYEVLSLAMQLKKPVLGICRGLQLINVFLGGALVPDIPSIFHSKAHGKEFGKDQEHAIEVDKGSLLYSICRQASGIVNSAHHQSAALPAASLKISATAEETVVEAMEWKEPAGKPWLLMIQWHPERMSDTGSPFSAGIKAAFLAVCSQAVSRDGDKA